MNSIIDERFKMPNAFWHGLKAIGLSPTSVLRQAGLPITLHIRDNSQVTTAQLFRLWQAIETLSEDPTVGIRFATSLQTALLPPSSLVAFYARDYRDGLARTARFKRMCAPERVDMRCEGDECSITVEWLHSRCAEPAALADVAFTSFVELGRQGTGERIVPKRIELMRSNMDDSAYQHYFGCSVRFGSSRNTLVLDSADLDRPFRTHNAELLEMLVPALASALQEQEACSSVSDEVKVVLKRSMASGRPDLAYVARELGTSERTLQRRITGEGNNFRRLTLEARQDMVRSLLLDSAIEINEVAYLVGFEDANSFYRAFRSWEGVTPAQWRFSRSSH
ncbi:AraC family transcriptional regulator [Pseudomonas petrae]|uniref:AraC family transcriptional regulator n=1 Tax=Pseudomonas petrae TaxID=2912190 RepID=A0ABS9I0G0_9PSED|nr:AraC family transcriptional regulator [Pseudomonas petrae]MCF7535105.1 AraC family transcriptional regulator [Pseudomonas petrae]MCF7539801.1 AraC family transcriptional regulator [Pseudomonas petrae]MCF7541305.1 AraC family transcriptional regulator [Pseudomonas petrae]MCF7558362.1 AraC family transcriptional regulator [Pseudomonas petrae]